LIKYYSIKPLIFIGSQSLEGEIDLNIVEQLMVEHTALRLHFRYGRETNTEAIYELEEFIRKCHARIEDELVFPKLEELLSKSQQKQARNDLLRLEADHKLIDKIGDQIIARTIEGNKETLRKRILLYMNTVESHNAGEESLIFPRWNVNEADELEIKSKAWKVIDDFGLDRYFALTGVSEKFAIKMR
jgi:hemerythrin superfamily protein